MTMSTDKASMNITGISEALCSFLTTLLDAEAPLRLDEPQPVIFDEASVRSKSNIVFTAGSSAEDQWAVILDPAWLPLLSKSMLGDAIAYGEPGADDLLKELSAQAYGAVRTQLASANIELPEVQIDLLGDADELVSSTFSPALLEVRFQMAVGDQELVGFAMIPAPQPASEVAKEDKPLDIPEKAPQSSQARPTVVEVATAAFPELGSEVVGGDGSDAGFALLAEVELEVTVELGRRKIPLADVLRLTTGSVIELDKLVGEPLEVYANGRLIAEGEAVVMDEQFGIRITSLASNRQRTKPRV
jgi:flagellar motor switch protein FliN/FliY